MSGDFEDVCDNCGHQPVYMLHDECDDNITLTINKGDNGKKDSYTLRIRDRYCKSSEAGMWYDELVELSNKIQKVISIINSEKE